MRTSPSRHSCSAYLAVLLLASAATPGLSQQSLTSSSELAARLDQVVTPVARYAAVGVYVRSLDRGDELYARNADEAFTPASNEKLLVAAAALDTLGAGFQFTTRVHAIGRRRGDRLEGDLILQGGGDPTLTTADLSALADAVAARGIRRVTGRVRGTTRSSTGSGTVSAGPGMTWAQKAVRRSAD